MKHATFFHNKQPEKEPLSLGKLSLFMWVVPALSFYLSVVTYTLRQQTSRITASDYIHSASLIDASAWTAKATGKRASSESVKQRTVNATKNIPSRVWNKSESGFPCYSGQKGLMIQKPAHEGFLFQRPKKVGSTTMVSVVLRLAHNRSPWLNKTSGVPTKEQLKCSHRSMHGDALGLEYDKRDRSKSFLFSLLRHPTKRAISEFFHFLVSIYDVEPTDANFKGFLSTPELQHNYLYDLSLANYTRSKAAATRSFLKMHNFSSVAELQKQFKNKNGNSRKLRRRLTEHIRIGKTPLTKVVQDILDGYDFIAITERMDESLVAMQMLLNLTTKDVLYTRARSSGSFSNGPKENPCIYIQPSFLTPSMKEHLESPEWQHTIRGDMLLYEAANASLDRTIEALGRKEFQKNLAALKAGLELAEKHCKGRVRSSCTEGGDQIPMHNRTCYIWGEACDHECLNDLALP
ncbi:hypothetical protein ACA910_015091 [Epithemia clementina (nom. ined.)]